MKARHLLSIPMITFGLFASHALSDASEPWQLGLQDPATPIMESMLFFHHYLMILLVATGVFVSWMLGVVFFRFDSRVNLKVDKFSHDSLLETFWTIVPVVALAGVEPNEMILGPETAIQAAYVWASSKRGISLMRNVAFRNKKALIWLATVLLGANCSGGLSTTGIRFGGVILVGILLLVLGYFSEKAKEEPAPAPVVEPVVVVEPQVQPVGTDEGLSCEGAGEVCLRFLNIAQVVCVLYITGGLPLACNLSLGFVAILVSPSAESSLVGSFFGGGEKGEEATPALENVGEATVQQLNPQWWEATYTEGGASVIGPLLFFGFFLLFYALFLRRFGSGGDPVGLDDGSLPIGGNPVELDGSISIGGNPVELDGSISIGGLDLEFESDVRAAGYSPALTNELLYGKMTWEELILCFSEEDFEPSYLNPGGGSNGFSEESLELLTPFSPF